jgi:hypothetical protein
MNGERTAEQYAESATLSAQRSAKSARDCADALLESKQTWERAEVTLGELTREVKRIAAAVAVQAVAHPPARPATHSLIEEDFEDSPTGTHKLVSKRKFEQWTKERGMTEDARKWRTLWRRVRWAVWLTLGGAAGLVGEQLAKHLLHL